MNPTIKPLTPRTVARAIGVSESSIKRWCDRGLIPTRKTAGGHRRITKESVIEFLRSSKHKLVQPELLGLPASTGQDIQVAEQASKRLSEALLAGDEEQCERTVFELHLNGFRVSQICDEVFTRAFAAIGDLWDCGQTEIYRERRACEICSRVLTQLRGVIPKPQPTAPIAIGGTPQEDPYGMPTMMVEMTLQQMGWRAQSLGCGLPFESLHQAVVDSRPSLVWLSISQLENPTQFIADYHRFYEAINPQTAIVIGGRAVDENLRKSMRYSAYCDTLGHLEAFTRSLHATGNGVPVVQSATNGTVAAQF